LVYKSFVSFIVFCIAIGLDPIDFGYSIISSCYSHLIEIVTEFLSRMQDS
jgi:hypothetical protein